jgi:hypothetical protein
MKRGQARAQGRGRRARTNLQQHLSEGEPGFAHLTKSCGSENTSRMTPAAARPRAIRVSAGTSSGHGTPTAYFLQADVIYSNTGVICTLARCEASVRQARY